MASMAVISHEQRAPVEGFTLKDLDAMPDDGNRYELVDGLLLVTPAPIVVHQRASRELFMLLHAAIPDDLELFFAPLDFRPTDQRSLQPDLLVVRTEDVGEKNITKPLVLAVEILSPSTRLKDLRLKHSVYEESGIQSYWIVDPTEPSLRAFELNENNVYTEVAHVVGGEQWQATRPFPVTVKPSDLV